MRIFLEPWEKNDANGWSSSAKKAMFHPASLSQKGLLAPIIRRDDLTWTEQELTKTGVEKGLTKHDGNVARRYTKYITEGHIPDGWYADKGGIRKTSSATLANTRKSGHRVGE